MLIADRPSSGHAPPELETRLRHVLIAGGGVAALEAMLALRRLAPELEVELLAPERTFSYRPLAVLEPFGLGAVRRFDLRALVTEAGGRYRAEALVGVHPAERCIRTRSDELLPYDALVIAAGARPREAIPGALTFWGVGDGAAMRSVLADLEQGEAKRVAFAVSRRPGWTLPLYELALMTAHRLAAPHERRAELIIVTPESAPLELFGPQASDAVRRLLENAGIGLCCGCQPVGVDVDGLQLSPGGHLSADRVIALPALEGPHLDGLPKDEHGFIPTDSFGCVEGLEGEGVYAAGDVTSFPVKQGGIAAQQADAVAEKIASLAGAEVEPRPFRPVLRGLLLTGSGPSYMRAEIDGGAADSSEATPEPLWWPPAKIAGKFLAPHLASLAGEPEPQLPPGEVVPVQVELNAE